MPALAGRAAGWLARLVKFGAGGQAGTPERPPQREEPDRPAPEDLPGEPGAAGGSQSDAAKKLPALPAHDDSPLGDTDQHSEG